MLDLGLCTIPVPYLSILRVFIPCQVFKRTVSYGVDTLGIIFGYGRRAAHAEAAATNKIAAVDFICIDGIKDIVLITS
jgi:hypothetical protein